MNDQVANRYFNRELTWLEFNDRVLDQARSPDHPLLERMKFLAITGSNLDEFFMVRVGGLTIQKQRSPEKRGLAGRSPSEQLAAIRSRVIQMVEDQYECFDQLMRELADHEIRRVRIEDLTGSQQAYLDRVFEEEIASVISPIAVNDVHNFPAMIGASLGLCVRLEGEGFGEKLEDYPGEAPSTATTRFVVLPVRRGLQRIWPLPSSEGLHFVLLEDILAMFAERYFPGQKIVESAAFRTMRNADVTVDEDAADLLSGMAKMLLQRRTSDCVRLEVDASASRELTEFLQACLEISDEQVYPTPGPLDLSTFISLGSIQGYRELKEDPWPPQPLPAFHAGQDIFDVIAEADRVLVHPYQEYQPVVDFVMAAAADPEVIAIKQTLYRTSRDSEIVAALGQAAEAGKHVTVILELKARFDEKRNIDWARRLEESGVDVIYGVRGLKTHAKVCLVVRRESSGIRRYLHFGTGNYNESTAKIYSDISLFTCDPELGKDAVNLFNAITGLSLPQPMHQLIAAPIQLREKLVELIDVEIASAKEGRRAGIRAKFNSLVDRAIIEKLYEASEAGVTIELNVRGICCLRPGAGFGKNIRVISVVDRYLEHARIFHFHHGGDPKVFISSADWMNRNLDRRIELMVPVNDPNCAARVIETLNSYFEDNVNAYEMDYDGNYHRRTPHGAQAAHRSQEHLYATARELAQQEMAETPVFEAHRAAHEPT